MGAKVIAPNKKRRRQLEWEDTRRPSWVAWLGGICAVALVVALGVMSQSDRTSKPMNINGDQIGPFYMSNEAYVKHAKLELANTNDNEPRWALVTPTEPLDIEAMGRALKVPGTMELRVSTLLVGPVVQIPVPEPTAGLRRADVFDLATKHLETPQVLIDGVLVFAHPEVLKRLAENKLILAVEPAPAGAAYGRMGIRAMTPEGL